MHGVVLMRADLFNHGESQEEMREQALSEVDNVFDELCGSYIDYFDAERDYLKSVLITKSGETTQVCRASEFECLTDNDYPFAFAWGSSYRDCFMYEEYGFGWDKVIDMEIKRAVEDDKDDHEVWLVVVDVHI